MLIRFRPRFETAWEQSWCCFIRS